jgi:hypothetical protein
MFSLGKRIGPDSLENSDKNQPFCIGIMLFMHGIGDNCKPAIGLISLRERRSHFVSGPHFPSVDGSPEVGIVHFRIVAPDEPATPEQ